MLEFSRAHNLIVAADFTVRACADADVVTKQPIIRVVLALMARLCIRRDLIVAQTLTRQFALNPLLHINCRLVIGHARRMLVKKRIWFNG